MTASDADTEVKLNIIIIIIHPPPHNTSSQISAPSPPVRDVIYEPPLILSAKNTSRSFGF